MKRTIKYMIKYWYLYLIGTLGMVLAIALDMNSPIITGRIIDEVIIGGEVSMFKTLILLLVMISLGRAFFGYFKELTFDIAGANIIKALRKDLFDHIQGLSQNFFEEKNTGELMSRLKDDGDKIWHGISFGIMLVVEMLIVLIVACILMLSINVKLSLITFIGLPFIGYFAYKLEREIDGVYEKISEKNAELNTTAQENIAGVRLVKAFAREKHEIKKFLSQNKAYYDLNMDYAKSMSRRFPNIQFISDIIPILVVVLGGAFVIDETLTVGTLAKFMGYSYMIVWPMRMIGWISSIMAEAFSAMKQIDKVFDQQPEITDSPEAISVEHCLGTITFDHVHLSYKDQEVLKDINFTVKPGQMLAIMGTTGSGKTSIINLLERFYDPSKGQIMLDGRDIRGLTLESLRSKIAVVMQEVFLFSDSILNNIHFGSKKFLAMDNIMASASAAEAHDFINRMEESYDTVIGERGIGLSGGQKQRISIARAFSKEAKILVMDDATSALDMETEHEIQKEVNKLKGVTKIIVAHRISAVKEADEIIILDHGEIVERGTHASLLQQKGRYFNTFNEQYEGYMA
ncbi:MAG: ABC transporter [Firmicutes bacterium HGW-Firmicutes-2]|nr:MAG: ABC transporter [Firmicutes bacterium HGW-Firmicutes-2]